MMAREPVLGQSTNGVQLRLTITPSTRSTAVRVTASGALAKGPCATRRLRGTEAVAAPRGRLACSV